MSFPISGNCINPLYKSINTFSFYIYICGWHNLHKQTHMHTQSCRTEKKISSATGWHILSKFSRGQICTDYSLSGIVWSCRVTPSYPSISNFTHSEIPSAHMFQLHLAQEQLCSQPSVLSMDFKSTYMQEHNLHRPQIVFRAPSIQLLCVDETSTQPEYVISMYISVILYHAIAHLDLQGVSAIWKFKIISWRH